MESRIGRSVWDSHDLPISPVGDPHISVAREEGILGLSRAREQILDKKTKVLVVILRTFTDQDETDGLKTVVGVVFEKILDCIGHHSLLLPYLGASCISASVQSAVDIFVSGREHAESISTTVFEACSRHRASEPTIMRRYWSQLRPRFQVIRATSATAKRAGVPYDSNVWIFRVSFDTITEFTLHHDEIDRSSSGRTSETGEYKLRTVHVKRKISPEDVRLSVGTVKTVH
jgi:hypothetical protein